jgi:hypothetical protein
MASCNSPRENAVWGMPPFDHGLRTCNSCRPPGRSTISTQSVWWGNGVEGWDRIWSNYDLLQDRIRILRVGKEIPFPLSREHSPPSMHERLSSKPDLNPPHLYHQHDSLDPPKRGAGEDSCKWMTSGIQPVRICKSVEELLPGKSYPPMTFKKAFSMSTG